MNRAAMIEQRLRQAYDPVSLEVLDQSHLHTGHEGAKSGGGHFDVLIVSERFAHQNQVKRHRLIYDALKELMPTEIHALGIKAYTPDEL